MSAYTRCVTFGITDYKTVEDSSRCRGYVAVGYLCDRKVTKHHFQTINRKRKRIEAKILKTRKEYL